MTVPQPESDREQEIRAYLLSVFRPGAGPRIQAQHALAEWLEEKRLDLFVTVRFNLTISLESARHRLRLISATTERHWLGHAYWKKPHAERSLFFAFLEEDGTGTHWHILWRLPTAVQQIPADQVQNFLRQFIRHKIARAASVDVQDLRQNEEFLRVITYSLKEYGVKPDRFVVSTEFHSARKEE